jgi:hypothetical protein
VRLLGVGVMPTVLPKCRAEPDPSIDEMVRVGGTLTREGIAFNQATGRDESGRGR